ncbi:hypothetical protein P153DRAFT_432302 [Dothidotthia symphoricarpi CBS 119687]|uniref:Uncharacterized protein n=1 Tax=Dothidotthia symphoricarpi CBS 119687 TaxID=1392245 RepID=A0A6A6AD88_9PLEO|nr:uncharacterized protein P153DRAFT_432302 [Dothidotthia symphoricarpi CBS 119687]KAF2128711.1 hypothetical protein P153DRAFT_432302 [Dothidotthia symphoricarpi CBS 119687]
MTPTLDPARIRTLTQAEIKAELQVFSTEGTIVSVTQQLLDLIERGSLSASTFRIWLAVSSSPVVLRQSLEQNISVGVRLLGIKLLHKKLGSPRWREFWDGLGGTAGLLDILSNLSVREVQGTCQAIGRMVRSGELDAKRQRGTELFKSLHPTFFPDMRHKTTDLRQLTKYYQLLVPSCSQDLVNELISGENVGRWRHINNKNLLQYHSECVGRHGMQSVSAGSSVNGKTSANLEALSRHFPSQATPEPGISASMAFSLDLLRELVQTGTRIVDVEWAVDVLIRPLLKRAVRKKVSSPRIQEIVDLVLQYLERHPGAAKRLTNNRDDVLHLIASCWSRRSVKFERQLKYVLHLVFDDMTQISAFEDLMIGIPKSRRYALLRLCVQEIMGIDLDAETGLGKLRGPLTSDLLECIESSQALDLFTRLRQARGDEGLIQPGEYSSVLGVTRTHHMYEGDPDLYYLVLLRKNGLREDAKSFAVKLLETRKKRATSTSDREKRSEYAVSAWACANASGSLSLLSDTLQWTKRFIRDQFTARNLYATHFDETYTLLSGFFYPSDNMSFPELRQRIERANTIMADLFDVACSALHEPSFSVHDWRGTIELFQHVVKERLNLSEDLRQAIKASDDEMYTVFWEHTVVTLVAVEEKANQEGHERLGANLLSGILGRGMDIGITFKNQDVSTITFLDNLARARDRLWQKIRLSRYPAVLTLPAAFPRGLPVQHLVAPWFPDIRNLQQHAPYIFSRVMTSLFIEPKAALDLAPTNKEAVDAIGAFVDSYQFALRVYIPEAYEPQEKTMRLTQVWNHAIGPLSQPRMSSDEAIRVWKTYLPQYLMELLPNILPEEAKHVWPLIPKTKNPAKTREWNPLANGRPEIKARSLGDPTYIDISTLGLYNAVDRAKIHDSYPLPAPQVPAQGEVLIWQTADIDTDGGVLAALLYLDTKQTSGERLLCSPFPSHADARYPCLYLDEEFLSREDLSPLGAARYLNNHVGFAPPPLLYKLTEKLLKTLDPGHDSIVLEQVICQLIQALGRSDRPSLASILAIQVIIEQPSASSWNRILLNRGFFQRLSTSSAKDCVDCFAGAVVAKLDAQAKAKEDWQVRVTLDAATGTDPGNTQPSTQSFVKITTVKLLIQLLHGTSFIGDDSSLNILSVLSEKVSHIDVRISILKSLLSMLQPGPLETCERVFTALQPLLPLVGSLNEREPLTERDWVNAEDTLSLPDVQPTNNILWSSESSMLAALIVHYRHQPEDMKLRGLFSKRIVVPLLDALKQQTTRWATLFLRKYAMNDLEIQGIRLPTIPRGGSMFKLILSDVGLQASYLPRALLDEYAAYITFNISPPDPIRALNKRLRDDPVLKSQPEVQTWLDLYGNGLNVWTDSLDFDTISDLATEDQADNDDIITPKAFQESFLIVFAAMLWNDSPTYSNLHFFTGQICQTKNLSKSWWTEYGRTTVEAMLVRVCSIRTQNWERDPSRRPAVLPDTYPWRLLLLAYPFLDPEDTAEVREEKWRTFAQQLAIIIDEKGGAPYHIRLAHIKDYLHGLDSNGVYQTTMLTTLVYLSDRSKEMSSQLPNSEMLQVDLAKSIMERVHTLEDDSLKVRLRVLVSSWIASENEYVRRVGFELQEQYFQGDIG